MKNVEKIQARFKLGIDTNNPFPKGIAVIQCFSIFAVFPTEALIPD
jgi:hypothetical protein